MHFATTAIISLAIAGTGLAAPAPGSSPANPIIEERACSILSCLSIGPTITCIEAALAAGNPAAAGLCAVNKAVELCGCLNCLTGIIPTIPVISIPGVDLDLQELLDILDFLGPICTA